MHRDDIRQNLQANAETVNIIADTVERIGDRFFSIFKISDFDSTSNVHIQRLIGYTSIAGNQLEFRYDLLSQKKDSIFTGFFERALKNLETVEIKDGN